MSITNFNHYNPCFWSALWNEDYYENYITNKQQKKLKARKQTVFELNLQSGKVHHTITENVHRQRQLGIAEFNNEAVLKFVQRFHPDQYQQIKKELDQDPACWFLDFENHFSIIEDHFGYKELMNFVKTKHISTLEEKVLLASFIIAHRYRSYGVINNFIKDPVYNFNSKFEAFYVLKYFYYGDRNFLMNMITPLLESQWTFYFSDHHQFPLSDTPILVKQGYNVLLPISPRILLSIDFRTKPHKEFADYLPITRQKLNEFTQRMINNCFHSIVFSDQKYLTQLLCNKYLKKRIGRKIFKSQSEVYRIDI